MSITQLISRLDDLIRFKRGFVTGDTWVDNPLYPHDIKSSVQHVPIKHIISHQETVKSKIVKEYKKKSGRDLPTLHKVGGKYFVEDGNHRIVAKKEKGEKTVRARVFEKELIAKLDNLIEFQRGKITLRTAYGSSKVMPMVGVPPRVDPKATGFAAEMERGKISKLANALRWHKAWKSIGREKGMELEEEHLRKILSARPLDDKLKKLSVNLDDLIEFKLYQPKGSDEPPKDLPLFKEGEEVDYNVQRHHARRAGLHRDVRIGNIRHGLLSWATRKDLPGPGETTAIHQQSTHPHSYLGWSGNIPSGYGAGDVQSEDLRKALVTKSSPEELHATLSGEKGSHRLAFVKTKLGWLFSKGRAPQPPPEAQKPPAKSLEPGEAKGYLKDLPAGSSVQPKIDGALVYVGTAGGRPEIFSHRVSKTTGMHPVHTERVFRGRPTVDIPREHQRTLIGELYGKVRGKSIPPQELGGILNAHIHESIRKQKKKGIKLKVMPFDYVDGQDEQYAERLAKVRQTLKHLPADVFHPPEEATTPGAAHRLYEKIRSGRHPLTSEGVVIHPPTGKMIKVKHTKEANVTITGTFPGKGKYKGSHGGFTYGPGGKVGSGFSDETRAELKRYIGRSARIRHQGEYETGKHRAPVFIAVNE